MNMVSGLDMGLAPEDVRLGSVGWSIGKDKHFLIWCACATPRDLTRNRIDQDG